MLSSLLRSAKPAGAALRFAATRSFASTSALRERLEDIVPAEIERVKEISSKHGNESLGSYTVSQAYGGMRGITGLVYETSLLDPLEGIRFRGLSIPECQEQLPSAKGGEEPLPESLLWLLLCNEVPTAEQTQSVTADLAARASLPAHVEHMIDNFPKNMHPMTQFASAIAAMNTESEFAQAYQDGLHKSEYWKPVFEDAMNLVARLPLVASRIYRRTYFDDAPPAPNPAKDWAANFANMLGYDDPQFEELMRLYQVIHSDHEGGNVSAHAVRLVGSALSDPYLSFAAGMAGLAGPLHGLANQECLKFITDMQQSLGEGPYTNDQVKQACWDLLNSGKVIPGFGHAVLRKTDPRYMCQREFALKHMGDDPLIKLTAQLYEVAPGVLEEQGKAKNPWPNVDAHSGVLLVHYGFTQEEYYTVLFGVSRALGTLSSLVWDRALSLPIERPKSVTSQWIAENFGSK